MSSPYMSKGEQDFKTFAVIWNQRQNMTTPDIHLKMIDWLEWSWKQKKTRLLLQAFRSAGKSSIVGLFAAWLLYRHPDLRILVLAADEALAKKMVRNVRRILERHPLSAHLLPKNPDQWAGERFTIRRAIELRDPSMLAKGITANLTGSRADVIICDDVEVPNTSGTPGKREELRKRLNEISFILMPGGTQIYIGTPHTYHTIYAPAARTELGEEKPFLEGFERLSIPVRDKDGASVWPQRYSEAEIERILFQSGPNKFASQMMLEPRNIAEGRLDPKLLQIYDEQLDYAKELQTLSLGKTRLIAASSWWDPAFAAARGDRSVLAVVYADAEGNLYLHHMAYIKAKSGGEKDEATQQCETVAEIAREHFLPSLTVEANGIGKFLPAILRGVMHKMRVPCAVQETHSARAKDERILEAFDAPMAARRLFVHRSVLQTPFIAEMQEWRPGRAGGHDDGLDAAAGAISLQPVRLPRLCGKGGHTWTGGQKPHSARTQFDV